MTGIYEIMHDEDYWKDPETFRPKRFLNETSTKVINTERLIPFGYGKRICIGSLLAQSELYLFVASFLQRFKFEDPNPSQLEPKAGFVLGCPSFTMKITERAGKKTTIEAQT
jgi:methyl farnesoate epoxidase/farnesoate epoxidase